MSSKINKEMRLFLENKDEQLFDEITEASIPLRNEIQGHKRHPDIHRKINKEEFDLDLYLKCENEYLDL